jgi:hypothetical protein
MTQCARAHALVLNQIHECLKSTKEAYVEADAIHLPNSRDRMFQLYSDLIDLDQDFQLYADVMADASPTDPYNSISGRFDAFRRESRGSFQAEKQRRLSEVFEAAAAPGEEDDVAFAGGDSRAGLVCPLTQQMPAEPVVSRVCRHVFERNAIVEYIRAHTHGRVHSVTCPMAGCTAQISLGDLAADPRVKEKIAAARRAQDDGWDDIH